MENIQQAEKCAQESVAMLMKVSKPLPPAVVESAIESILQLQSLHIFRSHPELSEKIFAEIVEPNFPHSFEDFEYFEYLVTLANLYATHDFPEFAKSKCQVVLNIYGEHAENLDLSMKEHSEEDEEALDLAASARSLLGHLLLNQGKVEESMDQFSRFEKGNFRFKTISKHFEVTEAAFLYLTKESHVGGQFVINLSIRDFRNIFLNTRLKVTISNAEGEPVWEETTLIRARLSMQVRSQALTFIQRGRYVAVLAVIDPMTEEAFLHRHTIWVEHSFSRNTPSTTFFDTCI